MHGSVVSIDWGSVPDWLAGIGAVLALIFAAAAAKAAWAANKVQARQLARLDQVDLDNRASEERAQASKIAAWIRMVESGAPAVVCFNGSALPIYRLKIFPVLHGEEMLDRGVTYSVKGPDSSPRVLDHATSVIKAAFVERGPANDEGGGLDWGDLYAEGRISVSISFVDSAGRSWRRGVAGRLERNGPDPAEAESG
ncbi:hypothetical protein PA7_45770 [Pseudonocardia asaccharolytica DSM 44247 = NBRC 16224]|uniref:Uncharacterized protein n=1 Tax=Pseudonocardia asaccharolytica DSM 44247 = NBRC 16224 TaxID=1123024 RepID=A0A511D7G3_9PSEU|nr:hypothetical protein PA7_45770 [Pseudonocardia asaccharolytica DSM 44247 = NBRC 16224]